MENTENLHIYLKTNKEHDHVLKDATPHEKYIILCNETLQSENKSLNKQVHELSEQVENLEEECGKYETGKVYLKGFLKNLVLASQLNSEKSEIYKKNHNSLARYQHKTYEFIRYFQIIFAIFVAVILKYGLIHDGIMLISFIAVFSGCYEYNYKRIKHCNPHSSIKEIDIKIQDLEKGNDFLHEYIDIL